MGSMTEMHLVPQRAKSSEQMTVMTKGSSLDCLLAAKMAMQMVLMSETSSVRLLEICLVQLTEMLKDISSVYLSAESKAMKMVLMTEMNWVLQMV